MWFTLLQEAELMPAMFAILLNVYCTCQNANFVRSQSIIIKEFADRLLSQDIYIMYKIKITLLLLCIYNHSKSSEGTWSYRNPLHCIQAPKRMWPEYNPGNSKTKLSKSMSFP